MYKQTIRPVLFLMEPEKVHALLVSCLKCYRHLPWCRYWIRYLYTCSDKQLIWNHLTFRNRIGLSAGFDIIFTPKTYEPLFCSRRRLITSNPGLLKPVREIKDSH